VGERLRVDEGGSVKPACELWAAISKAGVPLREQPVYVAGEFGKATMNDTMFRPMGDANLRVLVRG
jgi:hypothetical protein